MYFAAECARNRHIFSHNRFCNHYLRMGRFGNLGEREVAKEQNISLYGSYVVNDQIAQSGVSCLY